MLNFLKLPGRASHSPVVASEIFEAHQAVVGPMMMDIVVAIDYRFNKVLEKSVL